MVQLQEEVKSCSSADRQLIMDEMHKGGFKVEVPVQQILGMLADLTFPLKKLRDFRRNTKLLLSVNNIAQLNRQHTVYTVHRKHCDTCTCLYLPVKGRCTLGQMS